jgi:hypothetical protein
MGLPDYTLFRAFNRCTGERYYFKNLYGYNYGEVGDFFCYNNEVYEIVSMGGGGTISAYITTLYPDYTTAFSNCPCGLSPQPPQDCQRVERISEYFYFYFDDQCSVNSQQVMFLNSYGVFDYYSFRGREDSGYDIQREDYTSAPSLYTEGWVELSYYGWNPQSRVWNNQQSKTGILHTGIIPKSDADYLSEQLLRSPKVYLLDEEGDIEPIILTNTEVVKPNFQIPNQVSISIQYKHAYPQLRQNK